MMSDFAEELRVIWNNRHEFKRPSKQITGDLLEWLMHETSHLGELSIMQRAWHVVNAVTDIPVCPICGVKTLSWRKESQFMRYSEFCGSKCANATGKPSSKRKVTCQERYGVDHTSQVESVRDKAKQTNLVRYGVKNTFQYQIDKRINAMQQTIAERHDMKVVTSLIEAGSTQKEIGTAIGLSQVGVCQLLQRNNLTTETIVSKQSSQERAIALYIESLGFHVETNTRDVIAPHELDIFIPSKGLAVEVNGVYWHGETKGRGLMYHVNKTNQCEEKGIQLLQFYDFECNNKPDIVKSIIASKLGATKRIYGRHTVAVQIEHKLAAAFLDQNHLQGHVKASFCVGLYCDELLVAVATLSKSRYTNEATYELIRFANILNTTVVGGLSKLLTYFQRTVDNASILSYADRRYSKGESYQRVGFGSRTTTQPNYRYFSLSDTTKLYSRVQFQKHKLANLLDNFNETLTEWENMKLHNYDRVWDCGNVRLIKNPA